MSKKKTYEVGYAKPPVHTQFKSGQSGNLKGRPRSTPTLGSEVHAVLKRKITVVENGRRRSISYPEAAMLRLAQMAAKGDITAIKVLLLLVERVAEGSPLSPPYVIQMTERDMKL